MTVIRCPRCRDEVTVPPRATARALVRCPLCLEQYLLAEALANAPPLLVIIGGEVEQAAIEHTVEPGSEYRVAAGPFGAALDASAPTGATLTIPRPAMRPSARPRRKESSGLGMLVSVVGGGVLAAPLALLTLWWVFGVDPPELGPLGPKVAQHAPWLVPAKLRGQTSGPSQVVENGPDVSAKKRPTKEAIAAEKKESEELQTLPDLTGPAKLTDSTPAIEAPQLDERKPKPANDKKKPAAESRPPMPDLTDLLPDSSKS